MKRHLYEFRASTRKLTCQCGWEKTLKNTNPDLALKEYEAHCDKS